MKPIEDHNNARQFWQNLTEEELRTEAIMLLFTGLVNAADDEAAEIAGVPIGAIYHDTGNLRIRLA